MKSRLQFDELLMKSWDECYAKNSHLFRVKLKYAHLWEIKDSPYYGYYDKQLVENKREAQIATKPVTSEEEIPSLVQEFNPDAFNYTMIEPEEILMYVDLEKGEVIAADGEKNENTHPIIINNAPLCKYHCLLPLYLDQMLPQVISGDVIKLVSNLFLMVNNTSLRIGFNSIGAYASVNHLHLQLMFIDQLFPQLKMFPVERFPKQSLFNVSLTETSTSKIGVAVSQVQGYPVRTIVLSPLQKAQSAEDLVNVHDTLSEVLQNFVEVMIEQKIPHNIMIADLGTTIYIFPRQHQQLHFHEAKIKPAWLEMSGMAVFRSKEGVEAIDGDWYDDFLQSKWSLTQENFDGLVQTVKTQLIE